MNIPDGKSNVIKVMKSGEHIKWTVYTKLACQLLVKIQWITEVKKKKPSISYLNTQMSFNCLYRNNFIFSSSVPTQERQILISLLFWGSNWEQRNQMTCLKSQVIGLSWQFTDLIHIELWAEDLIFSQCSEDGGNYWNC